MRLALYGSASNEITQNYIKETEALWEVLAKAGHSLVFGGGSKGLMGAAARGTTKGGGKATGVMPRFLTVREPLFGQGMEVIYTETMSERKATMERLAEGFIIAPGGIGTFDEFFEGLTLKKLGQLTGPIILYNIDGFWDELLAFMNGVVEGKFVEPSVMELFSVCSTPTEVLEALTRN